MNSNPELMTLITYFDQIKKLSEVSVQALKELCSVKRFYIKLLNELQKELYFFI
jgi:hypothetical protein